MFWNWSKQKYSVKIAGLMWTDSQVDGTGVERKCQTK